MRLSRPNELCYPKWTMCRRHRDCAMLQIFSLKLITANLPQPPPGSGIEIYGFMAARDLLDPLRNYVFNRTRDDPLVIHQDQLHSDDPCLIYLSGPKRGITLQAPVLLEYDMKIKRGGEGEQQDVPLIHGVAIFSNKISERAVTTQIAGGGDHGAAAAAAVVEISHARFPRALEATVQVKIIELTKQQDGNNGGLDLSITGFVPKIPEDIRLFRGVVDEPCELDRFVVAVASNSYLILRFETPCDAAGSRHVVGRFAFRCGGG
ncbi:hypothetical protein PR202_ga11917 [Eleusine coracana subsp. coracana]|uniref:DUF6598 domain-containing protein n=1 Tax=Eleusine coracana subsp. coracana TaxID=191504 RepID=A0AAV5CAS8_ELECO|nr:hypothetical protein QOZ80_5AG0397270 [Eleusine coracana subsp. coracana]GJM95209.1 hypothetical protein PR202_ga11917 [Eleusine coracana subsp. coracana]